MQRICGIVFIIAAIATAVEQNTTVPANWTASNITHPPPIFSNEERIVVTNQAMGARCAVAADFDGDGRQDLVSASSNDNAVSWYRNEGNDLITGQPVFGIKRKITWSSLGSRIVTVADINMDGHVDVVGASYYDSSLRWFENDGTGEFIEHLISTGVNEGQGVTVADIDNNGTPDIVTASSGDNTIAIFKNMGDGIFCEIKQVVDDNAIGARTVVAADLNGDGWIDLASASKDDGTVSWYPNDGTGRFQNKIIVSSGIESEGAYSLVAVDIDNDGHQDLVVASNGNDHVSLWRNNGTGNFTKTLIYGEADFVLSVTAVDFDRDGDLDVASASFFDGYIRWYENVDGKGNEWRNHTIYVGDQGHYVSHGDMDGDGDDDLIAVTHAENTVAVFLAHTECDDIVDATCCHIGTEWNGDECEPCGVGTYGLVSGTSARCEACPSSVCSITGLTVVPATCAGITGCSEVNSSIEDCSCSVDMMKDPETDTCIQCPVGQSRPDEAGVKRTTDSIGNYTLWEIQQGVCAVPEQEEELNHIGSIIVVGLVLMSASIGLAIFLALWTHRNRQARIVRASQPLFLVLICIGTVVMASAIVPLSIDDGMFSQNVCNKACMAVPWLLCTGFTVSFSALFSKLYRINRVMGAGLAHRKIKVTESDMLKPFLVLFVANVIVLFIWTLQDPVEWERWPINSDQPWNSYGSCRMGGSTSIVCGVLIALFTLSSLMLACVEGYKARTICDEFSESKYIGIAVICWLQVLVIGLPLLFLVNKNPVASYFLKAGIIFIVSSSLLLLLFVPKIIMNNKKPTRVGSVRVSVGGSGSFALSRSTSTSKFDLSSGELSLEDNNEQSDDLQGIGMTVMMPALLIENQKQAIKDLKSEINRLKTRNRNLDRMLKKFHQPKCLQDATATQDRSCHEYDRDAIIKPTQEIDD